MDSAEIKTRIKDARSFMKKAKTLLTHNPNVLESQEPER